MQKWIFLISYRNKIYISSKMLFFNHTIHVFHIKKRFLFY